ncbi:MAG: hypothetical protein LBM01_01390 [Christensenellaceae bacterium]|nr:hypothetical protein [Christensenellaceae bacterium]
MTFCEALGVELIGGAVVGLFVGFGIFLLEKISKQRKQTREEQRNIFITLMSAGTKRYYYEKEAVNAMNRIRAIFPAHNNIKNALHAFKKKSDEVGRHRNRDIANNINPKRDPLMEKLDEELDKLYVDLLLEIATVCKYKDITRADLDADYAPKGIMNPDPIEVKIVNDVIPQEPAIIITNEGMSPLNSINENTPPTKEETK